MATLKLQGLKQGIVRWPEPLAQGPHRSGPWVTIFILALRLLLPLIPQPRGGEGVRSQEASGQPPDQGLS